MEYLTLKHYGVKGMRWGVRHIKPKNGSSKGKRRIGWDDDILVSKGTKAYRISTSNKENASRLYVTVDQNDRNFYKGTWGRAMRTSAGTAKKDDTLYENIYKTKKDLVSPSAAKRQKYAADISKDPDVVDEIARNKIRKWLCNKHKLSWSEAKAVAARAELDKNKSYLELFERSRKQIAADINQSTDDYKAVRVLSNMGGSDIIKKKYGERVAKEGYNMIVDDHGADFAGNRQMVNSPLIVLNVEQTLKQIGSNKLSIYDERKALQTYSKDISTIPGNVARDAFVPNILKTYWDDRNYYENDTLDYIY